MIMERVWYVGDDLPTLKPIFSYPSQFSHIQVNFPTLEFFVIIVPMVIYLLMSSSLIWTISPSISTSPMILLLSSSMLISWLWFQNLQLSKMLGGFGIPIVPGMKKVFSEVVEAQKRRVYHLLSIWTPPTLCAMSSNLSLLSSNNGRHWVSLMIVV